MVSILAVEKASIAESVGIRAGDKLLSINGHAVRDVLDYRFYMTEREITLRP